MNLIFLAKALAGTVFSSGMSVYGTFVFNPGIFGYYASVNIYSISEETTENSLSATTVDENGFKCKFLDSDDSDPFDCEIYSPKITDAKNTNIVTLKKERYDSATVNAKDKFTRIKINRKVKGWESNASEKKIAIISGPTKSVSATTKIILKPFFAKSSNKIMGKSKYFVGQADDDFVIESGAKYSYSGYGWNGSSEIKIFSFSSNDENLKPKSSYKDLKFEKTETTSLKQNKHYLIECEEKDLLSFQSSKLTYTKKGGDKKSTSFSSVNPVIYDEKNNQILNFLM